MKVRSSLHNSSSNLFFTHNFQAPKKHIEDFASHEIKETKNSRMQRMKSKMLYRLIVEYKVNSVSSNEV